MKVRNFLSKADEKQIVDAIREAELNTSGEIRLHVEGKCPEDVLDKAVEVFYRLGMHETELQNGVLFYVAVEDHKFAIIGDKGINNVVPSDFWDGIKQQVQQDFRNGNYAKGLATGIISAGEQLKAHFPYQDDDVNELPDDISYDE